jgi:hypothetical protein
MRSLSPDNETIYCYAQRLLNPFRGVTNIVRYQSAEAVTMDGVHWDIYVANDALKQGLDATHNIQISDIRYGSWSREQGLKRGPIFPSDEFKRLEHMGAVAYEHLLEVADSTPLWSRTSMTGRRRGCYCWRISKRKSDGGWNSRPESARWRSTNSIGYTRHWLMSPRSGPRGSRR